jgi:hypothetical protein
MIKKILLLSLLLLIFCNCKRSNKPLTESEDIITISDTKAVARDKISSDLTDSVSLKVKMEEHSVRLVLSKEDMCRIQLSDAKIKELKYWWDSLPLPLQAQIKAHEVEIELVSNICSSDKKVVEPVITDSRIENTGAILEKIIGGNADMTFTVNTTILQSGKQSNEEQSTNIVLVKKMPARLTQFTTEFYLADKGGLTNQNIHSLQYWWSSLPDDLRFKIQNREVFIDLTCVAIDKGVEIKDKNRIGEQSDAYAHLVADLLQEMIGYTKVSNKNILHGIINTQSQIERAGSLIPADYLIRLQLKNVKPNSIIPSI